MATLVNRPVQAFYREGKVHIFMDDGMEIAFPVAGNDRLEGKDPSALNNIEISPFGLHWPDLDEDLSIAGILAGHYGKPVAEQGRVEAPQKRRQQVIEGNGE